jgi:hypothetical protein
VAQPPAQRQPVKSFVTVYNVAGSSKKVIYSAEGLYQAPNWSPDSKYLLLNTPYQFRNLWDGRRAPDLMARMRSRLADLLHDSHDDFLPGTKYGEWFTRDRDMIRNAVGPVG